MDVLQTQSDIFEIVGNILVRTSRKLSAFQTGAYCNSCGHPVSESMLLSFNANDACKTHDTVVADIRAKRRIDSTVPVFYGCCSLDADEQ